MNIFLCYSLMWLGFVLIFIFGGADKYVIWGAIIISNVWCVASILYIELKKLHGESQ